MEDYFLSSNDQLKKEVKHEKTHPPHKEKLYITQFRLSMQIFFRNIHYRAIWNDHPKTFRITDVQG